MEEGATLSDWVEWRESINRRLEATEEKVELVVTEQKIHREAIVELGETQSLLRRANEQVSSEVVKLREQVNSWWRLFDVRVFAVTLLLLLLIIIIIKIV